MTHPLYIIGVGCFIYVGILIGYAVGWRSALTTAAKMACVQCQVGRPLSADGRRHTHKEGYAGDILLPYGECASFEIRELKGGRS